MQTIKINPNSITKEQVALIADRLNHGQVVAYPTDTIYGLGCDARNTEAIRRVNKIKGKTKPKPLLVLISDFKMLRRYCFINLEQEKYLNSVWPGPVTVILKRRPNLPDELTGGLNTIAVRLPKNDFLTKIISQA